jgi:hypothetical protein
MYYIIERETGEIVTRIVQHPDAYVILRMYHPSKFEVVIY